MDMMHECLCIRLRRAAQTVTQYYDLLLAPSGLKLTQFSLLHHIRQREPVSITELARVTGLDRTTMGKNLHVLALFNKERGVVRKRTPSKPEHETVC
jgi:DNA-binding MarR family transcriptional regulator